MFVEKRHQKQFNQLTKFSAKNKKQEQFKIEAVPVPH
jgi:hypothetical protein